MVYKKIVKKNGVGPSRAAGKRPMRDESPGHSEADSRESSEHTEKELTVEELREELRRSRAKQVETDALLAKLISEHEKMKAKGKRKHSDLDRDDQSPGRSASMRRETANERTRGTRDAEDYAREDQGSKGYAREDRNARGDSRFDRNARDYARNDRGVGDNDRCDRGAQAGNPRYSKGYKDMTPAEMAMEAARRVSRSPFVKKILEGPQPEKGRLKEIPVYDGTSDPLEHIFMFQEKLRSRNDATQCLAFPSSLSGGAVRWFRSLEEGTIDSFLRLSELFITQYVCFVQENKNISDLFALKQLQGERLSDYVKRFTQLNAQIEGCDSQTAALAFRAGLVDGSDLQLELFSRPPRDMAGVLHKAHSAITVEELRLAIKSRSNVNIASVGPPVKSKGKKNEHKGNRPEGGSSKRREFTPMVYTKLNTDPEEIWKANRQLFQEPFALQGDPNKRDRSLKCDFHHDFGHETRDCLSLKGQIEAMLRKGLLTQYVVMESGNGSDQMPSQPPPAAQAGLPKRTINMIQRGNDRA